MLKRQALRRTGPGEVRWYEIEEGIFVDSGHVDPVCEPTGAAEGGPSGATGELSPCRAREVLQRVGDKWSMYAIDLLGQGTMRFSELHRSIDGITARMLTVTLRGLERDGIVTRMGRTLLDAIGQLVTWADSHLTEIGAAQAAYDAKHPAE